MSLQCRHTRQSLVRGWDEGLPFALMQCDTCGAVGPTAEREGDPFVLPELDVTTLRRHQQDLHKEIRRLENLLKPGNPQLKLALDGAKIEAGRK